MSEHRQPLETPLSAHHRSAGVKLGAWFGCALPEDFGNPLEEQRYANESVALLDKNYRAYIALSGPDRVRYLNAIVTNDVKSLTNNHGRVALLLNAQGHIVAELEVRAEAERLFCISYAMIREPLLAWLDKYIIMDDVTMSDESEGYATLGVEGPRSAELVKALAGVDISLQEELGSVPGALGGIACQIERRSFTEETPGAEFLVERGRAVELWNILREEAAKLGGGPMGYAALNAQRLAQGAPWFGYDFGEKQIPHEAGLEQTHISYTKGCYTGQEIIERVRSRGQVNRNRVSIIFEGGGVPPRGERLLNAEGAEIGHVTRAAQSWHPRAIVGMGYVRREAAVPGTKVAWAGGAAEVIATPLRS